MQSPKMTRKEHTEWARREAARLNNNLTQADREAIAKCKDLGIPTVLFPALKSN
jgi:tartrate dehydratase alpha subunit/fumarate hydratase class I-like protein